MAEKRVVVADSGPLIGLARIGLLDVLKSSFDEILIPTVVADECRRDLALPGAKAIHAAIEQGWLEVRAAPEGPAIAAPVSLGAGERAVIHLAVALKVGVLMDDQQGRRAAKLAEVPILGTGGLLLLAKQHGAIERLEPLLAALRRQGYHLSQALVDELLRRADETGASP